MKYGSNSVVTSITPPHVHARPKRQTDERQNLYVLGLPFSLTKCDIFYFGFNTVDLRDLYRTEFSAIFSRYGTVTHCVILATVDNSSRRRGFVVMSCHEEAKLAITSLTRTQIKCVSSCATRFQLSFISRGHCLDISWAVVQRSQGDKFPIILVLEFT